MFTFLTIAGGVALILFGVGFLRGGLDRLFGMRLGSAMQSMARTRLRAFATGLGVSVLAPSSTTISMLAVQTVQAGKLSPRQVLAIMLGADIGLTMTVQLLALRIEQYAPVLILFGVLLYQWTKTPRSRGTGQVILAMGFIFMGILTIKSGTAGFSPEGDMARLLDLGGEYPWFIAVVAAVVAMLLQSSTATIALLLGMLPMANGDQPLVSLDLALAWVVGTNVGLALTTLLLGWGRLESKRLALGNLLAKLLSAVLVLSFLQHAVRGLQLMPGDMGHQVANAHTLFNVAMALLTFPLVTVISGMVEKMTPSPGMTKAFGPRYINLNEPIDSMALALGQSRQEILHMSEVVRGMLTELWQAMRDNDEATVRKVAQDDDKVDLLDEHIKRYLTRLVGMADNPEAAGEQMRQLRYAAELETIGDIIDKNLSELALKKLSLRVRFSDEGWKELYDFFDKVCENMQIAEIAFTTRDRDLAKQLLRHKDRLDDYNRELRDRHFRRLNAGLVEALETSAIHLDLLTHLRRINSAVSHVAFAILQTEETSPAAPEG